MLFSPDVAGLTRLLMSQRHNGQLGFRTSQGLMQTPWKKEPQPLPKQGKPTQVDCRG